MKVFDKLNKRGYLKDITHEEELSEILNNEKISFYVGIDPTADSLHIGHFFTLITARHLQKAGHRPIILVGGGTATIGDPSDRNEMRRVMTMEEIESNKENIKKQISNFLTYEGENGAILVDNADWLNDLKFINFMREIGIHFNVNDMLRTDSYRNRLEEGLTFFEMGYLLLQSYDYLVLNEKYGCRLQIGGSDQWTNILGGVNLIDKKTNDKVYGMTLNLLTKKDGKKMGKTEKGALWIDENKTTPFEFYQYFRNVDDIEVEKLFYLLTFLEDEEIEEILNSDTDINEKKKRLAFEITSIIHGKEKAQKAIETAESLFSGKAENLELPEITVANETLITDVIIEAGYAKSRGEAKKLISSNSIRLNDELCTDLAINVDKTLLNEDKYILLQKGKKAYTKVFIR